MGFAAVIVMPLLYSVRQIDDNSLTSWKWVFNASSPVQLALFLAAGIASALVLSGISASRRQSLLSLFILSIAVMIPLSREPEVIIDASRYFIQAKYLKEYGIYNFFRSWGHGIQAWTDMPVIPFIYGVLFSFFGESRQVIQIFTAGLFSGTVLLTCRIGTELWDQETGLHAGLLLLGIPYLLVQVPLLLVDVPTMFFVTLTIFSFLTAVRTGGRLSLVGAALALFTTLFTKYSVLLMLPVLPLILIVFPREKPRGVFSRAAAIVAGAGVLTFAAVSLKYDVIRSQLELLSTYQLEGLGRWQEGYLSTFLFQVHPLITVAALYGIYRAVVRRERTFLVAGWFAIFLLIFQIQRARYLLPLFPLLTLMAAYGAGDIRNVQARRMLTLSVVAVSLATVFMAYMPFLKSTSMANLMAAGEYLDGLPGEVVEVHALPQRESAGSTFAALPLLDYYTNKKIVSPMAWDRPPLLENDIATSSLRFTWNMDRPSFYRPGGQGEKAAEVVLADYPLAQAPGDKNYKGPKIFSLNSGVFRYSVVVSAFRNPELSQTGQ